MSNTEHNEQVEQRRAKLAQLRDAGEPYPNDFRREHRATEIISRCGDLDEAELKEQEFKVCVAGRLMTRRIMGKASFAHIRDETGDLQIYLQRDTLPEGTYQTTFKKLDLGDIVGINGTMFRTRTGELTVAATQLRLLVKSLRPLPEKFHGLTDIETRYRQRYLDLMVNTRSREVFRKRAATITALRRFLDERGYLEIESPIMQSIPGGANARPFITHHHALDMDLYLRVAQELSIKRCLVGGFERVYELNRNFRNEGLSTQHNPEFTMLEYNETYLDYHDYMDLTEEMLRQVVGEVMGVLQVPYQDALIDFAPPFERVTMVEAVCRENPPLTPADCLDSGQLTAYLRTIGLDSEPDKTCGELLLDLFEETVEVKLTQPTFITGYPAEVSPLARRNRANPQITDRFELFAAGRELANGFSELNDVDDQASRFLEQAAAKAKGDEEAMSYDADYITALEYGLPPNAGGGLGVDRFVMILTDSPSIRDVLLFPHMRPETSG